MAVASIGLNFVLVPRFGLIGAASATSAVLVAGAIANALVVRHTLGIDVAVWGRLLRRRRTASES